MDAELAWLWAAIATYVLAGSVALAGAALGRVPERVVLGGMLAGVALHAVSLALRWGRLGHGPFVTLFEVLSSNVFSLTLVFALAYWRVRVVRPGYGVPVMRDAMSSSLSARSRAVWTRFERSFWSVSSMMSLSSVGISGLSSFAGLCCDIRIATISAL